MITIKPALWLKPSLYMWHLCHSSFLKGSISEGPFLFIHPLHLHIDPVLGRVWPHCVLLQLPSGFATSQTQGQSRVIKEKSRQGQKERHRLPAAFSEHVSQQTLYLKKKGPWVFFSFRALTGCSPQVRLLVGTASPGSLGATLSLGAAPRVPARAFLRRNADLRPVEASRWRKSVTHSQSFWT